MNERKKYYQDSDLGECLFYNSIITITLVSDNLNGLLKEFDERNLGFGDFIQSEWFDFIDN